MLLEDIEGIDTLESGGLGIAVYQYIHAILNSFLIWQINKKQLKFFHMTHLSMN